MIVKLATREYDLFPISVDGEEQKETKNVRFEVPVSRNLLKLEKGMVLLDRACFGSNFFG